MSKEKLSEVEKAARRVTANYEKYLRDEDCFSVEGHDGLSDSLFKLGIVVRKSQRYRRKKSAGLFSGGAS